MCCPNFLEGSTATWFSRETLIINGKRRRDGFFERSPLPAVSTTQLYVFRRCTCQKTNDTDWYHVKTGCFIFFFFSDEADRQIEREREREREREKQTETETVRREKWPTLLYFITGFILSIHNIYLNRQVFFFLFNWCNLPAGLLHNISNCT